MAKLDAAERKAIPSKDFAGPDRSYPVEDSGHAKAAVSRSAQMLKRGVISEKEHAKIVGKADKVLGKSAPKPAKDEDSDKGDGPSGSDQVDAKVKPGMAGWST